MSPAISIALLLLSTTVQSWRSLEGQTKRVGGFPSRLKLTGRHAEETDGAFPGSCRACKFIVSKVKEKIGSDSSKAKIAQLLDNVCNRLKVGLIKSSCRKVVRTFKNKLIDAIAHHGTPRHVCLKLKLCQRLNSL